MKNGGGHFAPELGGHFKLELGGQYHWNLQLPTQMLSKFIFMILMNGKIAPETKHNFKYENF
jgi:hypothetical protein